MYKIQQNANGEYRVIQKFLGMSFHPERKLKVLIPSGLLLITGSLFLITLLVNTVPPNYLFLKTLMGLWATSFTFMSIFHEFNRSASPLKNYTFETSLEAQEYRAELLRPLNSKTWKTLN